MADEVWGEFQRTFIRIELDGQILQITPGPIGERGAYLPGQAGPLHVLTAWNPQGIEAPLADNRLANERLAAALAARPELTVWATTGTGEDGSWHEEGFTIAGLDRAEAVALAVRYDQRAIFEWRDEPGGFRLVACDGSQDEARGWTSAELPATP